jgi:hypothetical protein
MKNLVVTFGLLAICASAQTISPQTVSPQANTAVQLWSFSSPVMGKVIKGAPYSATEITESLQVLADGTRISHQSQVTVYRDSEGRVRRDTPERITIFDPVAGESYTLNPKAMTAVKSAMGSVVADGRGRGAAGGGTFTSTYSYTGSTSTAPPVTVSVRTGADEADQTKAALEKMKVEAQMRDGIVALKTQLDQAQANLVTTNSRAATEELGQRVMEGVTAEGTRTTETIEAGSIGNDRPIQVVNERWMSADLKTPVMTKHSDPRTGEESFRLTNVQRGEPGYDLFMLPPGYQVVAAGGAIVKKDE